MKHEILSDHVTLYHGDNNDMPICSDGVALITDPPYGIDFKWKRRRTRIKKYHREWGEIIGDDQPFDPKPWGHFPEIILWGGNNYAGLPSATRWLIWDKRVNTASDDYGDAELAWTNLPGPIRVHRQLWRGIIREGEENCGKEQKQHPTQKPIALMKWCVGMTTGDVYDPFMGSGTTGIACVDLDRPFKGVEINQKYFDISCRRIAKRIAEKEANPTFSLNQS
jgi:site-specific DNA-methyltransferase (adenine-specific)